MQLGISTKACAPGRHAARAELVGGRCAGCGIQVPTGLEWHELRVPAGKPARRVRLCPACHFTQHLDAAGRQGAGSIIWLPELEQGELIMVCHLTFIANREFTAGRAPDDQELAAYVERMRDTYQTFENRKALLAALFGGRTSSIDATNPYQIAQQMLRVMGSKGADEKRLAARMNGLRFLPSPEALESFTDIAARAILAENPLSNWPAAAGDVNEIAEAPVAEETAEA